MENGGITYPEGFYASGLYCGIKKKKTNDISMILSETPCVAAGTFTTNKFKSFSLLWSLKNINNPIRAVLINSGNANTCNGQESRIDTASLMGELAGLLKMKKKELLFASTGSIGRELPYSKIVKALPELISRLDRKAHTEAAKGILTTDLAVKEWHEDTGIKGRGKEVVIGAMAKGSGMINPSMATMLAFVTTDAVIDRDALRTALKEAVEDSFNMITVDNDTSTNDMVVCLANGLAKNPAIHEGSGEYRTFASCLKNVCRELAVKIAADGEGATKLIEVRVKGGWCMSDSRRIAKKIAGSNLFKSAVYGCLPNWGRILSSAGSVHARIDTASTDVSICGIKVYDGNPVKYDQADLVNRMAGSKVEICVDVKKGVFEAVSWGCDLTEKYVEINKE
ncbi:MAG TPA: bifunctional glutamate N-acetyltransferase/amino-acid acetyltransferase ArgJ [bacterium]|nr:bifunctional glutamate N-acetyltransferase/amino-acid acetyltransferase ArgJ [bacterium]